MAFAQRAIRRITRERQLWLIAIPAILWVLVFAYYPMYGLVTSFLAYVPGRAILASPWVGLTYFRQFFASTDFAIVLRNTLVISGLNILFGFPAPIILALLLNELRSARFKKVAQTISYLPYFISWVVAASLIYAICGNDGVLNQLLTKTGLISRPIPFLVEGRYFWGLITAANVWKSVGWSSIIYLSAIAGINSELYQAGAVDGLNRFGLVWHITLPGILPTVLLLLILQIGSLLNAGFEQQLLLGNPQTRDYYEVIDTYVYKYGIQLGRYAYGTAVGLMKSIISLVLILLTNNLIRRRLDISIV